MGFFSRIGNMIRGFFSVFVKGIEQRNPEAVYESAIEERMKQHARLMKAVSGIVYLRNKLERELQERTAELREVRAQIPVAVESGEDQAALVLIQKKDELSREVARLKTELAKTREEADEAKASLVTFQAEIEKLKAEKESMLARREKAAARLEVQDQLSGLSTEADIQALENVRESIQKLEAEADVAAEIADGGLGAKLQHIREQTATAAAQSELEEIKRQLAADVESETEQPPPQQVERTL